MMKAKAMTLGRYRELALLQFPHLEDIGIYESENVTSMNTGDVIIHYYAQPNVKYFTLCEGNGLSFGVNL
jgi:hypothetical protein